MSGGPLVWPVVPAGGGDCARGAEHPASTANATPSATRFMFSFYNHSRSVRASGFEQHLERGRLGLSRDAGPLEPRRSRRRDLANPVHLVRLEDRIEKRRA